MHHSFGAGLTMRTGGRRVAAATVAWGGGEGAQTALVGNSNYAGSVLTPEFTTQVQLRGVF